MRHGVDADNVNYNLAYQEVFMLDRLAEPRDIPKSPVARRTPRKKLLDIADIESLSGELGPCVGDDQSPPAAPSAER